MINDAKVLSEEYQRKWKDKPFYDEAILNTIDEEVNLHTGVRNLRSSAAACINVIGNIAKNKRDLISFLNEFNLGIEDIVSFPSGASFDDQQYNDSGNVVFEWVGPKRSPLHEVGGSRGQRRTSIDAFVLAKIDGKTTQLLIEWKFTETYNGISFAQRFAGISGTERLRRYSSCLAKLRKVKEFPFKMTYEGGLGLFDLGYEPYYQLLRMTLLAKLTTPFKFDNGLQVEDYRVVHLSHSENNELNILSKRHMKNSPGLIQNANKSLHEVWRDSILSESETTKFCSGYWNKAIKAIADSDFKKYLTERYS